MTLPRLEPPNADERARALAAMPPVRGPRRPPLTPGRLLYLARHEWPQWLVPGSPLRRRWTRRRELRAAERRLSFATLPAPTDEQPPLDVVLLTGADYVVQTLYAMKSWRRHAGRPVAFTLIDDSSLDADARARLLRAGGSITIQNAASTERLLDTQLPATRYPVLRRLRLAYFHLRKLTDTFLTGDGPRIVVDTDVLLHRPPAELLHHFDHARPFYFRDCTESYGVTAAQLSDLAGVAVPTRVNSGCFAFRPAQLDWDYLETVSTRLLARHGYSFYHEQALVAVLCGAHLAAELSDAYQVFPDEAEARHPTRTALHYLDGANNPRMLLSWPLLEN